MAVETPEDRALFFDPVDFGVVATVTPADGNTRQVNGIFGDPFASVSPATQTSVESATPTFHAREEDLAGIAIGDQITVNGTGYVVTEVRHDGTGVTALALHLGSYS